MSRQRRRKQAWTILLTALVSSAAVAKEAPTTAFFYGHPLPIDALSQFDRVVVEPGHAHDLQVAELRKRGVEVLAYVSVGEVAASHPWTPFLQKTWKLGENTAWASVIVDPANAKWRSFLLAQAASLRKRGYDGFFLDTLDSYQAVIPEGRARRSREAGLVTFVAELRRQNPGTKTLLNRGFELFPHVAKVVDGVAAESLFRRWNPETKQYVEVPEADRQWLLSELLTVRDKHGVAVTVLDYVPANDRVLARQTASRIRSLGFTPWVAQPEFRRLGVGDIEVFPRRVLLVYDGSESGNVTESTIHNYAQMPVEYLGYAVDYADVHGELPEGPMADVYAGIVTWFTDDDLTDSGHYASWLTERFDEGVPVAMLGRIGFYPDDAFYERAGWKRVPTSFRPDRLEQDPDFLGFEAPVTLRTRGLERLANASPNTRNLLRLKGEKNEVIDAVAITEWGGFAFTPFILEIGETGRTRWYVDPFAFLKASLRLPDMPIADTTTDSGRRMLTAHIDGDGFPSRAEQRGTPFASQVVLDEVLERYRIPHTVSVIEGETGPAGMYPQLSPQLESIARRIFALDHVEVATHTYSHPFAWEAVVEQNEADHLPLPGYTFDLNRELAGSASYIDRRLVPRGKRTKLVLWSGDCLPGAKALSTAEGLGLLNINGGNTQTKDDFPTLTRVSALGVKREGHLQVYAPVQNENVYTDEWESNYAGYSRVVETFRLTGSPRRLKPISIYYHFYSGAKKAAALALHQVYDWAVAQETRPVYLSAFVRKVRDFERVQVARRLDGSWRLRNLGTLRTLRVSPTLGWPDLARSTGVAGVRDVSEGRYVALTPANEIIVALSALPPSTPYLAHSNGGVVRWENDGKNLAIELASEVPLQLAVGGANGTCRLQMGKTKVKSRRDGGLEVFEFTTRGTGLASLACD